MRNRGMLIRRYLLDHSSLFIFVAVLFLMGVIFGALMVNALSIGQSQDLSQYLSSFVHSVDQQTSLDNRQTVQQTFAFHIKWVLLIWLLGLSVIGLPLIFVLVFLKGVLVGFSVGFLVAQLSWKGMLFSLVSIAPQNLIIIPAILVSSVAAAAFSLFLIKNRFLQKKGTLAEPFLSYTVISISMIVLLFGISVFEVLVTPHMMKWVTPVISQAN